MTDSSKTVATAYILAFLIAGLLLLTAFATGPALLALAALIPIMAGVGIVRRRVWSAYGFALYITLQVIITPILLFRSSNDTGFRFVASALFDVLLAVVFFRAGRSLQAAGAVRGRAWPWIVISLLFSAPVLLVQAFVVPSVSMENTILLGDRLLVRVWPKPQPRRDDIWALHYPLNRPQVYLKRIVGMPGDHIRLVNKTVYRNGAALTELYVKHVEYLDAYRDNFPSGPGNITLPRQAEEMLENNVVDGEVIVPQGRYFVLGDNRDDSSDSRYWGFVAAADLIGKPWLIYDSEKPSDWTALLGLPGRGRTRWNRILKPL